jgi:DDE superfamily endonuclease
LPNNYISLLALFAVHFDPRVWPQAQLLLTGAILARGQRTVCSALRVMGLSDERHFQNYHRVLNRAVWSSRTLSQTLLLLLVRVFAPMGPIVIGGDETIERRRGERIKAKGIYRDPVRSSHKHFVKASGLRWVTLMLLGAIPFAQRIWALPFLSLLAPSERYSAGMVRAHKTVLDWTRQALRQLRRWLPDRAIVFVGDSSYAAIDFLWRMTQLRNPLTMVVRFRMDAALYEPAPPRLPDQKGRPRKKGQRLPTLAQVAADPQTRWERRMVPYWYGERRRLIEISSGTAVWTHSGKPALPIRWVIVRDPRHTFKTQALLCTDLNVSAKQIVEWFVHRWQLEVTHREVREHLGVETQRQWSDQAIARTTPLLYGLFSLITLLAQRLAQQGKVLTRRTAWYDKPLPTFSDALAAVRHDLWCHPPFCMSTFRRQIAKLPQAVFNRFAYVLCYT